MFEFETKQFICDLLCTALRATDEQRELLKLEYERLDTNDEVVTAYWPTGAQRINVTMCSGMDMVRAITKHIEK